MEIIQARVEIDCVRREFFCTTSKALKIDASFDSTNERNPALTRTKVRRLYDIANVLSSINFIEKAHHPETCL